MVNYPFCWKSRYVQLEVCVKIGLSSVVACTMDRETYCDAAMESLADDCEVKKAAGVDAANDKLGFSALESGNESLQRVRA